MLITITRQFYGHDKVGPMFGIMKLNLQTALSHVHDVAMQSNDSLSPAYSRKGLILMNVKCTVKPQKTEIEIVTKTGFYRKATALCSMLAIQNAPKELSNQGILYLQKTTLTRAE